MEVKALKNRKVAFVRFSVQAQAPVAVAVGTSFISSDQAALNLQQEVGDRALPQVRKEANDAWEKALSTVSIDGATDTQRRTFYSCLYRTQLFPRIWHEKDAAGATVHRSPYTGAVEPACCTRTTAIGMTTTRGTP